MMRSQNGFTRFELMIASIALTVVFSTSVAAFQRLVQIWDSTRFYQLATQELSNQMERLTLLSKEECDKQLDSIMVSEELREVIPDGRIHGKMIHDDDGTSRIVLSFSTNRVLRKQPIVLIGWLVVGDSQ